MRWYRFRFWVVEVGVDKWGYSLFGSHLKSF